MLAFLSLCQCELSDYMSTGMDRPIDVLSKRGACAECVWGRGRESGCEVWVVRPQTDTSGMKGYQGWLAFSPALYDAAVQAPAVT